MASKASGQVTVVDVTDAYSVLLTSEAYTFIGNTAGAPSGLSCTTQAVAYCGAQLCSSVSISTVTCPTGISATISNNNTASPTITFKTTATITEACEATIPIVIDGVTINKKFSFAIAKQGTQGDTGATGKGISSVTPQYYISTSKTSATGGSWSDTAPTTIEKGTYLWTRMKVTYTNPASTEYTTATYDSMTDSRIEQLKDSITLSVTDGSVGNTAKIKLGIDDETKEASIDLTGAVTFSDLSTAGSTTINGANITTGTVSADRINVEELMAQHLTSTGGLDVTGNFSMNNSWGKITQYDSDYLRVGSANTDTGIRVGDTVIYLDHVEGAYEDRIGFGRFGLNVLTQNAKFDVPSTEFAGLVAIDGNLSVIGNLTAGNLESGSWTPEVEGASKYTTREGHYAKIGNGITLISFSVYGTFAGSTTSRIKITGCPVTSANGYDAGGGNLSGYYSASNVVFTGWQINKAGTIYAVGQQTGTTGATWGSTAIYQKASGDFSASGTIMVQTA
jgi:hypothetical protein